jgi:hypothetical protein
MRIRWIAAFVLVAAALSFAEDKKNEKKNGEAGPPIRVCVADVQNTSRRPVGIGLMQKRLIRSLKDSKAPKNVADKRRIDAVALEGDWRAQNCDYILRTDVVELRDKRDPLWQQEKNQGIGNLPPPGSRNEEVTFGEVQFTLLKAGDPSPIVDSSMSGEETYDENGTVGLLMDRVAQRVNSAVRESAEPMRE